MSDTAVKKRPIVDGLKVTYGLLSMAGRVINAQKPGTATKANFSLVCPRDGHLDTPHGVKQRYVCEEDLDGETFEQSRCLKGRETNGAMVVVSREDAAATKVSELPARTLDLRSHPYDPSLTFASGAAYIFEPDGASQFYFVLRELLDANGLIQTDSGPKMLIGMVAYRKGSEAFVRVERWGDQIVLRELVRPENVDAFEKIDGATDTKNLDMARQLIEASSEDFDADLYRSQVQGRIASLIEAAEKGETLPTSPEVKAEESVDAMAALLEASLAQAKAKA